MFSTSRSGVSSGGRFPLASSPYRVSALSVVVMVTRNKLSKSLNKTVDTELPVPQFSRTGVELSMQGGRVTCLVVRVDIQASLYDDCKYRHFGALNPCRRLHVSQLHSTEQNLVV